MLATGCAPSKDVASHGGDNSLASHKPFFLTSPETVIPPPPTKTLAEVFRNGVVIVVSKPSQTMHVFSRGQLWRTTPVSTGKRGKETPSGVYAILQKQEEHFSNLYNDAPMPFMQRLTWDGIAMHAGALPGYPASNGCIRIPKDFAKALFAITTYGNTAVIVTDQPMPNSYSALALARNNEAVVPIHPSVLRRY